MAATLTYAAVQSAVDARHWRVVLGALQASFRTETFVRGVELVRRVADLAEAAGHHPDVDLRYPRVRITLTTHDAGGLTAKDVDLAARISAVADELGIAGEPARPHSLEIAIDALNIPSVLPFWRAVLAYRDEVVPDLGGSPALVDPDGVGPVVWFQQMDAPRPQRGRIHLDVDVPHDVAPDRVAAAIAAGGRLVSDRRAPSFWVLADPEGNEACVSTWKDRQQDRQQDRQG
ncbi:4a-hydroxytetrahydrobiopterin dehydratase [Pengzhenrongella frigida]|uniref:Putative pterin-4-alpha-carbinolamine dehydratase n=1 Tax=Pengzhenrongella frigida TaxID=1259133 RepID=A0A4Q5MWZ8_9MICO|nr:4a-hydroxytetrahydrobiopterin dehydratase [Cellulomonas sp. HLT2-17]RYV50130.1 4a-hydroxytetrahydrobiopterin dehydratase [Cellulomonas sp. HLT2-17]